MKNRIHDEYPNILVYGYNAHYLNLLENDITPRTVLVLIEEVQKYFRNHHQPHVCHKLIRLFYFTLFYKSINLLSIQI